MTLVKVPSKQEKEITDMIPLQSDQNPTLLGPIPVSGNQIDIKLF